MGAGEEGVSVWKVKGAGGEARAMLTETHGSVELPQHFTRTLDIIEVEDQAEKLDAQDRVSADLQRR